MARAQRSRLDSPAGSTTARGDHAAAMSSHPLQVPVARPARNAAPRVVASSTGEISTARPVASARAWTKVGAHATVDAQGGDGLAGIGLGGIDEIGPALRDALEHGANDMGATGATGDAEQGAAGAVVPVGSAESEQGGHVDHAVGVGALLGDIVRRVDGVDDAEIVTQPFDVRAGRKHDRLDAPHGLVTLTPSDDREGAGRPATGERRTVWTDDEVEHPAGAESDLRRSRTHTSLADERGLLIAGDAADRW
jgi:hypothetical protein